MKKILYHGSPVIVEKPLLKYGKLDNDYGQGFYCTEIKDLAKEWAVDFNRDGYCNKYELDMHGLKVLNLDQYNILVWLNVLLQNRYFETDLPLAIEARAYLKEHFSIDYKSYDVIIGYRADDSYFSFAQDFISGAISLKQLSKAMKLGDLGVQVVLKSEKAFGQIKFVGSEVAEAKDYYEAKKKRDDNAVNTYFSSRLAKREKGDLYINQIIDEEIKIDDLRLQ